MRVYCPPLGTEPKRLDKCPLCGCRQLKIQETIKRRIKDQRVEEVTILKMYCHKCHHRPRVYPEGVVSHKHRSARFIFLGTTLYLAGLSYRGIEGLLGLLLGNPGWTVSDTTFWRDIQQLGEYARGNWFEVTVREEKPEVVIGSDGTYVKIKGEKLCLTITVDANNGMTFDADAVDERNRMEVRALFSRLAKKLRIRGVVTDDNEVVKEPIHEVTGYQALHQVCLAHAKKRGRIRLNRMRKEKELPEEVDKVLSGIVGDPQPGNEMIVLGLLREYAHHCPKSLKRFLQDWYRKLPHYTAYLRDPNLPSTNNRCEQAIGRTKVRYKTIRGFKSLSGALNFTAMTQLYGMHEYETIYNLIHSL